MAFHEVHVEPLLGHTDAVWVTPVPRRSGDDDLEIDDDADPDGTETEDYRHPFGFFNPPEKVWKAHTRLVLGVAGSEDQELVDEFSVKNAYYGNGLGKRETAFDRFKVRRPRYLSRSAKERRIKKELESK